MKKVLFFVAVAGMFTFVACGPSATEKTAAAAAAKQITADSLAAVETAERLEAQSLIIKTLNLPQGFKQDVYVLANSSITSNCLKLNENGFITYSGYPYYSLYVTEAGKPYLIGERQDNYKGTILEFKSFDIDFNEITGIAINKEQQTKTVRFSLKATNVTPIGKAIEDNIDNPRNGELVFKKFDNGWQLASNQNKSGVEMVREIWWGRN